MPTAAALIIASAEYEDGDLRQLRAPATDAERLADVLEEPAIGGFEVTTQLNQPSHVLTWRSRTSSPTGAGTTCCCTCPVTG